MQTQEVAHPDSLDFTSKPRYRKIGMKFEIFEMILSQNTMFFKLKSVMDLHPLFFCVFTRCHDPSQHSAARRWWWQVGQCQDLSADLLDLVGGFYPGDFMIISWWFHGRFWWFMVMFIVIKGFGHHLKCIERYTHRSTCRMYRCTNMIATKITSKCKENDPTSDWELYLDPNKN